MAETGLYTCDELVAKLQALDGLMDDGTTQSELDSGQSEHRFRVSQRSFREQFEKYAGMLQRQCPAIYKATFGPSVIKYGSSKCPK